MVRTYDQNGEEGGGVKSGVTEKKESERKNRKNATGRKYVVEIAQRRREVGDRSLLDRHLLFGSVLPLHVGNIEAREGWSGKREGSAISYTLQASLPHILYFVRSAPLEIVKIYRSPSIGIAILFNDLQFENVRAALIALVNIYSISAIDN